MLMVRWYFFLLHDGRFVEDRAFETCLRQGRDERLLHRVAVVRAAVPAVGQVLVPAAQKPLGRHRPDLPVVEGDVNHVRPLGIVVVPHDGQTRCRYAVDYLFVDRIRENAVAFSEGVLVVHVVFLDAPYDDVALPLRVLRHAHEDFVLERRHERREQEYDGLI